MRVVVYGAGAIGGVMGAELFASGHDVVLIARGEHGRVIAEEGLQYVTAEKTVTLTVPVVPHPSEIAFTDDDVVVLGMKSQHTPDALEELWATAGCRVPVFCAQNGVENERLALRRFDHVYGMCAQGWATHLAPGVVVGNSAPARGLYQLGRYPDGSDDRAERLAAALNVSGFVATVHEDVMAYKHAKLLGNLRNISQALFVPDDVDAVAALAFAEGTAALRAAGIPHVERQAFRAMLDPEVIHRVTIEGFPAVVTSTWQSLARGATSTETDYLNGEVALLGRLYGVPTPANVLLQQMAREAVQRGLRPATLTRRDFFDRLAAC